MFSSQRLPEDARSHAMRRPEIRMLVALGTALIAVAPTLEVALWETLEPVHLVGVRAATWSHLRSLYR